MSVMAPTGEQVGAMIMIGLALIIVMIINDGICLSSCKKGKRVYIEVLDNGTGHLGPDEWYDRPWQDWNRMKIRSINTSSCAVNRSVYMNFVKRVESHVITCSSLVEMVNSTGENVSVNLPIAEYSRDETYYWSGGSQWQKAQFVERKGSPVLVGCVRGPVKEPRPKRGCYQRDFLINTRRTGTPVIILLWFCTAWLIVLTLICFHRTLCTGQEVGQRVEGKRQPV